MTLPSFASFFEAVHGHAAFPWQVRLAAQVLDPARGWPNLLDLPTGVGKTSALDVALYACAVAPQRMPRRVLLVVDRRIVVDQGAEHARGILDRLTASDAPPAARAIAEALRGLWGGAVDEPPFAVATLRGGMPRDNDWARRPDQPVLGVSTVDQVGSRLLFRGYGFSSTVASIQAGLVGNDTLILLDEVHLAAPFAQTLDAIAGRYRCDSEELPRRFAVVKMSATAADHDTSVAPFRLAADDDEHPVLTRRLGASKHARLEVVKVRASDDEASKRATLAAAAVESAIELQTDGVAVVAVVVNRVDTARLVWQRLTALRPDAGVHLVTGRMRPLDRDRLLDARVLPLAGRDRTRATPSFIVATQCIEAGADLDFDAMVTESASLDALRQRFGRVDRRGERSRTESVILIRSDDVTRTDDPVYGAALATTWAWMSGTARDGVVDFGVRALPAAVGDDGRSRDDLLAPHVDAPVLLPAHLDAWAQTSPLPHASAEPDVALWLHGPQRNTADIQIVWRSELELVSWPKDGDCAAPRDAAQRWCEWLAAVRPSALEAITIPLHAARTWLSGATDDAAIADAVAQAEAAESPGRRRTSEEVRVLRWMGADSVLVAASALRPGDTIVLPTSRGGVRAGNFDPDATERVADLGDLANLRGRGVATLRLTADALATFGLADHPAPPELDPDASAVEQRDALRAWVETWPDAPPASFVGRDHEWTAAREALQSRRLEVVSLPGGVLLRAKLIPDVRHPAALSELVTEDDDSSFTAGRLGLAQHGDDVRKLAGHFARALGLSPAMVGDLERAAWLHDVGKADPRFQRWLRGGAEATDGTLLAKSSLRAGAPADRELARVRAGYPQGYRHELLSLAMLQSCPQVLDQAHDRDLVLHLVASHHGWCRPFPPLLDDAEDIVAEYEGAGFSLRATTRHRLAALDSGVSDRFWALVERYGWWGLAWLEAIVRLADHRASEAREEART